MSDGTARRPALAREIPHALLCVSLRLREKYRVPISSAIGTIKRSHLGTRTLAALLVPRDPRLQRATNISTVDEEGGDHTRERAVL